MNLKQYRKNLRYLVSLVPLALAGCRSTPAFNVLGSYFPAWLFCFFVGILLTIGARVALRKYNLGEALNPPFLMYSCLTALFTFTVWLIFFRI
jgi:YtcA family